MAFRERALERALASLATLVLVSNPALAFQPVLVDSTLWVAPVLCAEEPPPSALPHDLHCCCSRG